MNMQMLVHIGLLCMQKILELFILTVSEFNMLQKKLGNLWSIKTIMCGYFCTGLINFMFAGKTLIDFTSLFSPYDFEKNDNIILSYF